MTIDSATPTTLADPAVELVRDWLSQTEGVTPDASATRLAGLLQDPLGLEFALGFVDRVARPDDLRVAARNLEQLSRRIPRFLPWYLRFLIRLGGGFAPLLPWPIVPIARRVLRGMVGHLIIDATPSRLSRTLQKLRGDGDQLNINLLGEAVLGDAEADRRLQGIRDLVDRDDVDYVSVKVSAIVSQLSMWSFDETVDRVVDRLVPLYEAAALGARPTFLNLDMEEFRDLDLTMEVFERLLDRPSLHEYEAGIVLQAYLPEALPALERLTAWAQARRAAGGAGIKVRVVKGANLAMERVDAAVHDWPVAVLPSKQSSDTNYKRVLDHAFHPDCIDAVRIGVAGHNLFDIAWAHLLADSRGVSERVEFEMLLGMAPDQADAVRRTVGHLLLYTPVVHPRDFESAISYLIRRLEENASTENFMSGVFELVDDAQIFAREEGRFRVSLDDLVAAPGAPEVHRVQSRLEDAPHPQPEGTGVLHGFANEPDTDPALPANRQWGRAVLRAAAAGLESGHLNGSELVQQAAVDDAGALERIVSEARSAASGWADRGAAGRAEILHAAGRMLASRRANLLEVMVAEAGKTLAEGDPEISEATPPSTSPTTTPRARTTWPASTTLGLSPRGSPCRAAVELSRRDSRGQRARGACRGQRRHPQARPQVRHCAAVMVQALWDAGVPREVLRFVDVPENEVGRRSPPPPPPPPHEPPERGSAGAHGGVGDRGTVPVVAQ